MIGLWSFCVPLLTWVLFLIIRRIQPQFKKIGFKQRFVFIIPALLASAIMTWHYYNVPSTFHAITITAVVSQNQKVELIEIKANGDIIPPDEKKALDYGWQVAGDILVATSKSQPLTVSFKTEINAPVTVLFYASPRSGKARLFFEKEQIEVDLKSSENRQRTSTFHIRTYRGIPNWIFVPLLVSMDVLTIGSFFLFILFLQETQQNRLVKKAPVKENPFNHRRNITILLVIAGILHLLNSLAVPLILDEDSPTYLQAAIHWLEHGNLDVDSTIIRGPVSTLIFAPFIFLFGRNPWGIKMLLHMLAIACVPVSYRVGWQLGKSTWVAFISGLVAALSPDLFLYSNFLMSDLPNLFFVLVFCTLLISALETFGFGWVFATMLMGSFATLFRSENISLLLIGAGALFVSYVWQWKAKGYVKPIRDISIFSLSLIAAIVPILWWSVHNQRVYGFFGLSNYASEIFYDGWVYFGDASGLAFTDQNSQAVQEIQAVIDRYPISITDKKGAPTGWEIYPSLIKAGYTTDQSFNLLKQATMDSIKNNWRLTYRLLLIKIRAGLRPETTHMLSLPLPSESYQAPKMGYFDQENLSIPALILAQRKTYAYVQAWYDSFFPLWVYVCLSAMIFSLYRSPKTIWLTFILIVGTRIFIPNIMGLSHWRYTLAGLIPLQILGICWIGMLAQAGLSFFRQEKIIEAQKTH
jgi:4-amino-4-deoxy-L-arabinose transferase-like glycosyltransferase